MPDTRTHRGPHPDDKRLFGPAAMGRLRSAADDLSWLLSRGYALPAGLKLVGDRYELRRRQRVAIARCAATDAACAGRPQRIATSDEIAGSRIFIDGYNLLTTIEAALSGGVLILGRDGALRDMASMHGTYRKVTETEPALQLIGEALSAAGASDVHWLLDRPVSNSGRLAAAVRELADVQGWPWEVELVNNPDAELRSVEETTILVTADSVILDDCGPWWNLARQIVESRVGNAWIVDLSGE